MQPFGVKSKHHQRQGFVPCRINESARKLSYLKVV